MKQRGRKSEEVAKWGSGELKKVQVRQLTFRYNVSVSRGKATYDNFPNFACPVANCLASLL